MQLCVAAGLIWNMVASGQSSDAHAVWRQFGCSCESLFSTSHIVAKASLDRDDLQGTGVRYIIQGVQMCQSLVPVLCMPLGCFHAVLLRPLGMPEEPTSRCRLRRHASRPVAAAAVGWRSPTRASIKRRWSWRCLMMMMLMRTCQVMRCGLEIGTHTYGDHHVGPTAKPKLLVSVGLADPSAGRLFSWTAALRAAARCLMARGVRSRAA